MSETDTHLYFSGYLVEWTAFYANTTIDSRRNSMRRVVKWSTIMFLGLLVVVAILFVLLPAVFASRLGVVYSGSMEPAMPVGAMVWIEPVDPA